MQNMMVRRRKVWADARLGAVGRRDVVASELATSEPRGTSVALPTTGANIAVTTHAPGSKEHWKLRHVVHITRCNQGNREAYLLEHVQGARKVVDRAALVEIAGNNVAEWCCARPGVRLDHGTAQRLGIYDDGPNNEEWAIDFVMYAAEDTVVRVNVGVQRLAGKRYYGRNSDEPEFGWHEVRLNSLDGAELANVLANQGICDRSIPFKTVHRFRTGSVSIEAGSVHEAITNLDHYCMRYPLVPVRVSSCGARLRTGFTRKFEVNDAKMLICSTKELCLQASLVNAVARTVDEGYARLLMSGGKFPSRVSFTSASAWVNENAKRVALNRVRFGVERANDRFRWLLERENGIYLVRLRGKNVDHVVCVDSNRREILDCVERYPLRLSEDSLRCCVGDPRCFEKILETRIVVERNIGPLWNKNGSSKRMRKRRRE